MDESFDINKWLTSMKKIGEQKSAPASASFRSTTPLAASSFSTIEEEFDFNLFLRQELERVAELPPSNNNDDEECVPSLADDSDSDSDDMEENNGYPIFQNLIWFMILVY